MLKAGPDLQVLADNDMMESTLATPALSEGLAPYPHTEPHDCDSQHGSLSGSAAGPRGQGR